MRVTKLVLAFLLGVALAAPPGSTAQSRGQSGKGEAKVEKPQKAEKNAKSPQRARKADRGRQAKGPQKAQKAQEPRQAQKPRKAQKPQKAQKAEKTQKPRKQRETRETRRDARRAPAFRDQRRPTPGPRPDRVAGEADLRFRGMDVNGDRRISRGEWRGNDVSFAEHDWNGDGVLAGAEVIPGARRDGGDRFVAWNRPERVVRRIRDDRLVREERLLRERFGPTVIRTAWREGTHLRLYQDRWGHRIALAPTPLATRIDRFYTVTRTLDPYRPPAPDLVRVDFGIDLDPVDRFGRPDGPGDGLLDALALPLVLLATDALIDDVDSFVTVERFSSYDRDFDGYVAPAEWPAGSLAFDRYDADGDGYLVSRELYADDDLVVVDRDRLLLFQGMDRDHDGLVAPWEWPGDLDSFWFRDYNADGAVSLDEYLGLAVDRPVRDLEFDAIDYDRDGEIARVEWVGDPYRFHRLDRNDNGVVGRWEYAFGWLRGV